MKNLKNIKAPSTELPPLLEAVQRYIDAAGWRLQWQHYQNGQQGCCLIFDMDHASYKTFFDVDLRRNFFSITAYAPIHISEDLRASVAELLTRINYDLFLSKFEMDFEDGEVRVNNTVYVENGQLSQSMIMTLEQCMLTDMDHYFPAIHALVNEGISPKEALSRITRDEDDAEYHGDTPAWELCA